MANLLKTTDMNSAALEGRRVVVVGYGSQGRGQALNLRDSGIDVEVALRQGGPSWEQALADGWHPLQLDEVAENGDVICLLTPDMVQPEVYQHFLAGRMKPGASILFSHGFNVHYERMTFPADVAVLMVAPKGPGHLVRREYANGSGVPCLIAVHQDPHGTARATALAYAHAIGAARSGVLETSFAEETETDLFGEQAVLCGGATELVVAGWETLVDAGYSPEIAYFECLHELKLIVDLMYEGGLEKIHRFVSDTAKYGDLTQGRRVIDESTRQRMQEVLRDIQNGTFARQWTAEYESGGTEYQRLLDEDLAHPIESVGRQLRKQFRWLAPPSESPQPQEVTS